MVSYLYTTLDGGIWSGVASNGGEWWLAHSDGYDGNDGCLATNDFDGADGFVDFGD